MFLTFVLVTIVILRTAFWLLERAFATQAMEEADDHCSTYTTNSVFAGALCRNQIGWLIAALFSLFYGFAMKSEWQKFALYFNQVPAASPDPIFNKPIGFYLFSLPVYDLISSWYHYALRWLFSAPQSLFASRCPAKALKTARRDSAGAPWAAVSLALAVFLAVLAWRTYLSRFHLSVGGSSNIFGCNFY